MDETKLMKVTEVGTPCYAPEWALRQGLDIAARHIPRTDFHARSALASDIAQALYDIAPPICGGRNILAGPPPKP